MKQAVLNYMKISDNTKVASNRIALYIAQKTGAILIDTKKSVIKDTYDRIFLINGPSLFCDYREEMKELVYKCKQVIWVGNDYALAIPRFVKDHPEFVMFAAYENFKDWKNHHLVNWNCLTFEPDREAMKVAYPGLCYYGAFRDDRKLYFEKYLSSDLYDKYISSSKADLSKFSHITRNFKSWDGSHLLAKLGLFESCIYIEDETTHDIYCSPANRYYEALSTHTLQLFDVSVLKTFKKAELDISDFLVASPSDYAAKLKSHKSLLKEQIKKLRSVDYFAQMESEFDKALKAIS